jgi:molecular chaperone GrpE (heat shock protein)
MKQEKNGIRILTGELNNITKFVGPTSDFIHDCHQMVAKIRSFLETSIPSECNALPIDLIRVPRPFLNARITLYKVVIQRKSNRIYPCLSVYTRTNKTFHGRKNLLLRVNAVISLPEKVYQKLVQEKESISHRFDKLKTDVDIYQKNTILQKKKELTLIQYNFLKKLIPIVGEFERAKDFDIRLVTFKNWSEFIHNLKINLQMVYESLLHATNLVQITPQVGDLFNNASERVISIIYENNNPPNSVVEIIHSGYSFGEEILQPAEVVLSTNDLHHPNLAGSPMIRDQSVLQKYKWLDHLRIIFHTKRYPEMR